MSADDADVADKEEASATTDCTDYTDDWPGRNVEGSLVGLVDRRIGRRRSSVLIGVHRW